MASGSFRRSWCSAVGLGGSTPPLCPLPFLWGGSGMSGEYEVLKDKQRRMGNWALDTSGLGGGDSIHCILPSAQQELRVGRTEN